MHAEIIAIGTEILLGEIVDTNTQAVARALRAIGLDLFRTTTVGDNAARIAQAVREALERAQVVIAMGGLGPTIDDATREGVALALEVPTEFRPELWEQIQDRFRRMGRTATENNRRQAYLPRGATAIENPVGTAPAFLASKGDHLVIALPGVPSEMRYLLEHWVIPYLAQQLGLSAVIKTRVLRTAGVGESWLDDRIQDLERLANPTVGLSAHPGRVDIRLTAKASSQGVAEQMISGLEAEIRRRVPDAIYGVDDDTLEASVLRLLETRGWRLATLESGTGGRLSSRLSSIRGPYAGGQVYAEMPGEAFLTAGRSISERYGAQAGLAVCVSPGADRFDVRLLVLTPDSREDHERWYTGTSESVGSWAATIALDLLRRCLA